MPPCHSSRDRRSLRRLFRCLAASLLLAATSSASEVQRLDLDQNSLAPDWLFLEADHRTRYELLNDSFRVTPDTEQTAFLLRTRVRAGVRLAPWLLLAGEFQDSRMQGSDSTIGASTGLVNTRTLLRAYVELNRKGPFGGQHNLQAGRITLDVGDRRLVARNRFRNTSNAFTGVDWSWKDDEARELRLFWTMPVQRRPSSSASLSAYSYPSDRESTNLQFFGGLAALNLSGSAAQSGPQHRLELFSFGLLEADERKRATRNRKLSTAGFRLFRKHARGKLDYQVESVFQAGHMKSSTSPTARTLDHFAHFHHLEIGYRFDAPCNPRIVLQYDYASGDRNRFDGHSQRFDTLYGARRFDFGPTSIYGPFARANLSSPGIRAQFEPAPGLTSFVAIRPYWRATSGDVWTTASALGTSMSSKYLGTQAEIRVRWDVVPKNVRVEAGYAHLFKGAVAKSGGAPKGDADYLYTEVSLSF